jgi:O-antigen ligase
MLAVVVLATVVRRNRLAVILFGTAFVIFAGILAYSEFESLRGYLRVFDSMDVTLAGRPQIWATGIRIAMDHPVTGIGFYMWPKIYPSYGLDLWKPVDDTHNLLINMFVEQGIPGLILFVWLVATLLLGSLRLLRATRHNAMWYPFAAGMLAATFSRLGHEVVEADTLLALSSVAQVFWALLALQVAVAYIVARERSALPESIDGGTHG